ncbi:hypothetical protein [Burkholderia glumae]|uniref:hypothetical protein n=1 Tax=Burkholderia glumae TaxID=337 RepID=UPI0021645AA8|nr:hypothetical protein [Burkholderia glumae]UVS95688.1 hypothetical protein EFP19_07820 [Burkholderia glumae]
MTNNTTAPALTDEQHIIEMAAKHGIGPTSGLGFARALLTSPRAAGLPAPDLYWFGDHEHGFECPDDAAIVHGRKLGERFTLKASWYADMLFEVTKVPDDNDDDYEVRAVAAAPAAPVAEYDGNHVQNHCTECNEHEAECTCTAAVAADGAATDEPSEIEQVIACLGDDAAKLRDANPDDEMADNMEAAARMLFERAAIVEQSAKIADSFTCGSCGMDGKVGAAIRASQAAAPADAREPIYQCRLIKTAGWNDVSRTEFDACATNPARFETRTLFLLPADLGDAREPNQVYVECRQCDSCDHIGINDSHEADAACNSCGWNGPSPAEDKCPGCGDENCMAVACPKCSGRYALLAEGRFLADEIGVPADAGEAVAPSADLIARCRELLELSDHGESEQTALRALANTYRRDISPHDRRAMATSHTHLEAVKFVLDAAAQGAQGGKGGEA